MPAQRKYPKYPVVPAKLGMRLTVRGLRRLGTSSPQVLINCHKGIRVRGRLVWVRVVVTEISWDGSIRRRAPGTSGLTDAGPWETLIEQVLAFPAPYRAAPGRSVYVIHAADRAVLVGEQDPTGRTVPSASSRRLKPTLDRRRRSTSPSTGSAGTSPGRTHTRVSDRRVTAPGCYEKEQVTATIVYSSQ